MKAEIYCKPTAQGVHSFYLMVGREEYYLFSQPYRKGVAEYYGRGVNIDQAMKISKAHNDSAITRTRKKIPMYVKYVEKEFDIHVLEKTKKRFETKKRRCA